MHGGRRSLGRAVLAAAVMALAGGTLGCVDLRRPIFVDATVDAAIDVPVDLPRDLPGDMGLDPDGAADGDGDGTRDGDGADESDLGPDLGSDVGYDDGTACVSASDCGSGRCVDGTCCATECAGGCMACNVPGREGTCSPIPAGEDPADECAMEPAATCGRDGTCNGAGACRKYQPGTECEPASCANTVETPASTCDEAGVCRSQAPRACPSGVVCQNNACATSCGGDGGCQQGFFCEGDLCRAKLAAGASCGRAGQCASGYCIDGVCCLTQCTELCAVCNLAGSLGTCRPVPDGLDPRNVCSVDTSNSCGTDGVCNGANVCRRPTGTACGTASCSNGTATGGVCNGAGACGQFVRDCGAYQCAGTTCATSCTSSAQCTPGFTCTGATCVALPGPVLHWRLDESSGTTALDASGSNFHGVYGESSSAPSTAPTTSTMVAPLLFSNPASRAFARVNVQAIRLAPMPAAIKTNELTLSAWYRSTSVDPAGDAEELVSGGDNYNMRVHATMLEIGKHTSSGHRQCYVSAPGGNAVDGRWHHVAGVITPTEMRVYVDGVAGSPCALASPIPYTRGTDLWIGRHGSSTAGNYDFDGNIDDVRIWSRALSAAEIARLAAGRP